MLCCRRCESIAAGDDVNAAMAEMTSAGKPELMADPNVAGDERFVLELPYDTDWNALEDGLVRAGWYPKQSVSRLRVYGVDGGHEVVIEPATRSAIIRMSWRAPLPERRPAAERIAGTLHDTMQRSGRRAPRS